MDSVVSTISIIGEHNLDEVLSSLEDIQHDLEDLDGVKEAHRRASLIGVSMMIESAKLWHRVHFDENHSLYDMIDRPDGNHGHRKLQSIPLEGFLIMLLQPLIIFFHVHQRLHQHLHQHLL